MRSVDRTLETIRRYRNELTRQQVRTLCGQAKAGNPDAALKGLVKLLERGSVVRG